MTSLLEKLPRFRGLDLSLSLLRGLSVLKRDYNRFTPRNARTFFEATMSKRRSLRSTTILAVSHKGGMAIGGDGQVTLGNVVMKSDAHKIRKLHEGRVLVGFAGASADAFALLERFEAKLKDFQGSIPRAATELAKDWRMDRNLRRLEAMMIVLDRNHLLLLSGTGDVIQPSDGIAAIGSGGPYAQAAARALALHSSLGAAEIVRAALEIAADLCIFTNRQIEVEEIK
jgi:ATP-dependent HslUV protease subunit HslV